MKYQDLEDRNKNKHETKAQVKSMLGDLKRTEGKRMAVNKYNAESLLQVGVGGW